MKILKDICEWSDEKNKVVSESIGCDIVINGINNDISIGKNNSNFPHPEQPKTPLL